MDFQIGFNSTFTYNFLRCFHRQSIVGIKLFYNFFNCLITWFAAINILVEPRAPTCNHWFWCFVFKYVCPCWTFKKDFFDRRNKSLSTNGKPLRIRSATRCKGWARQVTRSVFGENVWTAIPAFTGYGAPSLTNNTAFLCSAPRGQIKCIDLSRSWAIVVLFVFCLMSTVNKHDFTIRHLRIKYDHNNIDYMAAVYIDRYPRFTIKNLDLHSSQSFFYKYHLHNFSFGSTIRLGYFLGVCSSKNSWDLKLFTEFLFSNEF